MELRLYNAVCLCYCGNDVSGVIVIVAFGKKIMSSGGGFLFERRKKRSQFRGLSPVPKDS